MLYIKDMNLVEILILSQSETKGKFNAFHHKGESEGSVHQMCFIKCSIQEDRNGKIQKPAAFLRSPRKGKTAELAAQLCLPGKLSWRLALAIRGHETNCKAGK